MAFRLSPNRVMLFRIRGARISHHLNCWSCASDITAAFECSKCGSIQRIPVSTSYFDVFQLRKDFMLDARLLESRYRELQRTLHPDKFTLRSREEQAVSATNSAIVNRAYDTLRRPLPRLKYILAQSGIDALMETSTTRTDPALLQEVLPALLMCCST